MRWLIFLKRKYNNLKFQILKHAAAGVTRNNDFNKVYLYFVIFLLAHFSKLVLFFLILSITLLFRFLL